MPGLREYLENIQAGGEIGNAAVKSARDLRTQLEREKLAEDLPGLIEAKDIGGIARGGVLSGIDELAKYPQAALTTNLYPKAGDVARSAKDAPWAKDQIPIIKGMDDATLDNIAAMPTLSAQKFAITAFQKDVGLDTAKKSQGLRGEKAETDFASQFANPLSKQEGVINASFAGVKAGLAQFKATPNKATRRGLAVSMARALGDSGVLSDQDMAAYNLTTIASDIDGLKAYLANTPEDSIPESVVNALTEMAENAIKNSEIRKKQALETLFINQVNTYGDQLTKGGKDHSALQNWKKKLGVDVRKNEEGRYAVVGAEKKLPPGVNADLYVMANRITDKKRKDQALKFLKRFGDTQVPEAQAEQFRKLAGE